MSPSREKCKTRSNMKTNHYTYMWMLNNNLTNASEVGDNAWKPCRLHRKQIGTYKKYHRNVNNKKRMELTIDPWKTALMWMLIIA